MKKGSNVGNIIQLVPDKKVDGLTEQELQLAYQCGRALMAAGIPAMPYYSGSGVVYDVQQNAIERRFAMCWLTCKGEAVITTILGSTEFTLEKFQTLANGIVDAFKKSLEVANDGSSVGPTDNSSGKSSEY